MNRPARSNYAFAGLAALAVVGAALHLGHASSGGGSSDLRVRRTRPAPTRQWIRPDPRAGGAIRGVVRFSGSPPARAALDMRSEAVCARKHGPDPQADDVLVADGRVAGAFVYIKEGLEDYAFETPSAQIVFDQTDCVYVPRIQGAMIGQRVAFLNGDPVNHNVHIKSDYNALAHPNRDMPPKGRIEAVFDEPEVMIELVCDRHPWMAARLGVLEHPFFAVTGADGRFEFSGLVPGEYVVEVWHERLGTRSTTARVEPTGSVELDFDLAD